MNTSVIQFRKPEGLIKNDMFLAGVVFYARVLVALSIHMQVIRIIKLESHSLKYFHSSLTAYLKAYKKQQVRAIGRGAGQG